MGNSPNWVLLQFDIANFNLTEILKVTFQDEIMGNIYLFLWNYVQKYVGQTECPMSVIDGKTTVIGECWDYAFVFRPIFAVAIATILMFWVVLGLTVLISAKLIIESSGMYTQI